MAKRQLGTSRSLRFKVIAAALLLQSVLFSLRHHETLNFYFNRSGRPQEESFNDSTVPLKSIPSQDVLFNAEKLADIDLDADHRVKNEYRGQSALDPRGKMETLQVRTFTGMMNIVSDLIIAYF